MFTPHVICLVVVLSNVHYTHGQATFLETFTPLYRLYRYIGFDFIGRTDDELSYEWNLKRGKVQKPFPESQPFFCDAKGPGRRSKYTPKSVHQLTPGDIDIVAAMGDSLTSGTGGLATNILQLAIENKGVTTMIGGQSTWRKYLTLPNILKEFNPNLYGYSLSDGYSTDRSSKFDVAEVGGMSRDIPYEAKVLIKRMSADRRVKINEHWKLITLLIGPNDFCQNLCVTNNPEKIVGYHEKDLIIALRILRDNLPRTMVNIIITPNLKMIKKFRATPLECHATHRFECPCLFGFRYESKLKRYYDIMERWQDVAVKISNMDEFNKEDFTVNAQPFLKMAELPTLPNGNTDFTYMSLDCFHLSQKGYARATNALWNNMMEPEGKKSIYWKKEFTDFKCPTVDRPYLATKNNS
ncbi:phospholipase B1, membrane-associated-like [Bradysia coprophila]|uniref:phospholipase B1, membrane-associated-like n=1 Tax=Bradysia coprophila TaxID=38358 RepID=UPI00187D8CBE|nr:phospholipase B1, membrane-associated-like [Bradysia coprophila]